MSFFYGINTDGFKSHLTIPRFTNFGRRNFELMVHSYEIKDGKWEINLVKCKDDQNFFYLNKDNIDNRKIFFLASIEEVLNYDCESLENFNDFTKTIPAFRSNWKIMNSKKGFSSYQSEYPFAMVKRNGSIISSVYALTNKLSDKNFVVLRNIFHKPIEIPFNIFIVDMKSKLILEKFIIMTNQTSLIELENKHLNNNCYLVSEKFIGIPQYLSEKNNHLSFEHTHPPHEYIQSSDRFKQVNILKDNALKIIHKKNFQI